MFLSDKLIGIGKRANPKNNVSMNEQKNAMLKACEQAIHDKSATITQAKNAFAFACGTLNKNGYPYYKAEQFQLSENSVHTRSVLI